MSFGFVQPWHLFLPRDAGHIVAICGSGGRQGVLDACAAAYAAEGVPVAVTSLVDRPESPAMQAVSLAALQERSGAPEAQAAPVVHVHGGRERAGIWRGLESDDVDELGGLLPDRVVLVQTDGPCPAALRVPVLAGPWPRRTSLAIQVLGIDAVGGHLAKRLAGWGQGLFAPLDGLPGHTVVDWDHVAQLLFAPAGWLDVLPAAVPKVLALAGVTAQDDSIGLFGFCGRVMEDPQYPLVLFCSAGDNGLEIRTACRERPEDEAEGPDGT